MLLALILASRHAEGASIVAPTPSQLADHDGRKAHIRGWVLPTLALGAVTMGVGAADVELATLAAGCDTCSQQQPLNEAQVQAGDGIAVGGGVVMLAGIVAGTYAVVHENHRFNEALSGRVTAAWFVGPGTVGVAGTF